VSLTYTGRKPQYEMSSRTKKEVQLASIHALTIICTGNYKRYLTLTEANSSLFSRSLKLFSHMNTGDVQEKFQKSSQKYITSGGFLLEMQGGGTEKQVSRVHSR